MYHLSRILPILVVLLTGWVMLPDSADGQFLRLTFEIESELEAEEMQSLQFGEVVPNVGRIRISRGDPNMGVYAITGMQNLVVDLTLEIPEFMELRGDGQGYQVPLQLEIAYANRNENNINHAVEVTGSHIRFPLRADAPPLASPDQPAPSATAYIYVFGDIDVGDIPSGVYEAEVFMAIEYD